MLFARSVVPLAHATRHAGCGTKAANLARMMALGHRVPRGIVVTDREYRRHLAACGITDIGADPATIRRRIVAAPLAPALRTRLHASLAGMRWPVAVRSSAAAEDSGGASFAGQLDSHLGVEGLERVEHALRTVWASLWSDRCRAYAQRQGLEPGAIGVIVQEQVDALCSGVLFTRDPLAGPGAACAVIEYVNGLGDRLVSGAVTPSRLRVHYGDGTVERVAGDGLTEGHARALAAAGLTLEQHLGGPQDIEWSVDRTGRIVLLQARPITAFAQGRDHVWSNANIAENFPDPVTPFLFSIVSRGYSAYFRNLALGFGISRRRVEAMDQSLEEIVGLQAGRLYYNLTHIHTVLQLAPGGTRLAAAFNQFTGASERPYMRSVRMTALERLSERVRVAASALWKYASIQRRVAAFEARVDAYAIRVRPTDLPRRAASELARDLEGFLAIRLERWNDAALADAAAMVCYAALQHLVARTVPAGQVLALQNDLLKGLPGLASARPVAELWALSRDVRADEQLARLFATRSSEEIAGHLRDGDLPAFRVRFERYLDLWGFRYSGELMLASPTPQEHPAPMIAILQSYLRDPGPGPEAISALQSRARLKATRDLTARLSFSAALVLRVVLRATQGAIRLRERARIKQALLYTRLRHVALCAGDALVERGLLCERDDVFFLTVDAVIRGLRDSGAHDVAAVRREIAARRAELARCARLQPPDSLVLAPGSRWQATNDDGGQRSTPTGAALLGTSACGGATEGIAHVIQDVAGIGAFRAGEILVTRQTDPGWAAVFFMVKGLVVERGGMLSHGAIIAREYGIPAVVGVNDATRRIHDGQRLRVDGDKGVVELASR